LLNITKMNKKIIFIICLIIFSFICLCCFKKSNDDYKTVIQFASWGSESEIAILKPILKEFENQNSDIKVDFMHIPQNYFQKIHLLFASNTAPDVIFINNQYLPIYANAGVLENLTIYDKEFEFEKFYKKSLSTMTWNEKIYAVPRDISNLVIFYNKDIFDKYGVKYPDKDWTFTDYLEIAKKLTHKPQIFGVSFEEDPLYYLPYITSSGFEGVPYYNQVKDNSGLKFYADLRNKYNVAPKANESASATMAQLFLQGRVAMHLSGRWLVPKYRQEAKFDWDVVEFPKGSAGSIMPMDSSGWAISKSSKHKSEAVKLVQYLLSEKSLNEFAKSGLIVPARIESANSKYFLDGQKPKNAKVFLDVVNTSSPTAVTVNYREILDELKAKNEALFNRL